MCINRSVCRPIAEHLVRPCGASLGSVWTGSAAFSGGMMPPTCCVVSDYAGGRDGRNAIEDVDSGAWSVCTGHWIETADIIMYEEVNRWIALRAW